MTSSLLWLSQLSRRFADCASTNTAFLFPCEPPATDAGWPRFKEEVTSARTRPITLRTRTKKREYFIKASAEQVVRGAASKRSEDLRFGKYEEPDVPRNENRETPLQDESIKNLPKGKWRILSRMILAAHCTPCCKFDRRGSRNPWLQPALYHGCCTRAPESSGANLRFKDPIWRGSIGFPVAK